MSLQQLEDIIGRFTAVKDGWSETVALERMREDLDRFHQGFPPAPGFASRPISAAGVPAEWIDASGSALPSSRVLLYMHGGGFAVGSLAASRHFCSHLAAATECRVLVIGYRLAPEHAFPAALEDASSAYAWLLAQSVAPSRIVLAGDSAGGGLVLSLLRELTCERSAGLPACAVLMTPWADLRCGGESYTTNRDKDPIANREMAQMLAATYLGVRGRPDDPRASPLLGRFSGFPPLLIQAAGRDVFMDDAAVIHARASAAGVESELDQEPEMIHQWQLYCTQLDEGRRSLERMALFIDRHVH